MYGNLYSDIVCVGIFLYHPSLCIFTYILLLKEDRKSTSKTVLNMGAKATLCLRQEEIDAIKEETGCKFLPGSCFFKLLLLYSYTQTAKNVVM